MSLEEAAQFLAEMSEVELFSQGEWHQLAIADAATDALLGDIGLHLSLDGSAAEIGFTLAKAAQGRGIATWAAEAVMRLLFERTSVGRIVGVTDVRNEASIRLLKRIGMSQHALREASFKGESCFELVFARER